MCECSLCECWLHRYEYLPRHKPSTAPAELADGIVCSSCDPERLSIVQIFPPKPGRCPGQQQMPPWLP